MHILLGGSSVYKARWNACDNPIRDSNGYITAIQEEIERKFGIYLLARGLVNDIFTYAQLGDILIIQTHRGRMEGPQPHNFWPSLTRAMIDLPDEKFVIQTKWDKATCDAIRHRIDNLVKPKRPLGHGRLELRHKAERS
jgi:hypothetical protein